MNLAGGPRILLNNPSEASNCVPREEDWLEGRRSGSPGCRLGRSGPSRGCLTAEFVPGWPPTVPPLALAPTKSMPGGTHGGSVGHSIPSQDRHALLVRVKSHFLPVPGADSYSLMRARAPMEAFLSPSQPRQANWKLFSPWRKGPV